ncbi:metallophosphoesterase [Clostridiisalibacter paucivorans]|uniref:metallophosphoesterase n=1 Tax=Clostridiisalibacter paucivorans TaxID=408753 RepID=UPI00047B2FFA|nr:metallophosphoesterase [Clostridiisalibacter paucivorans]
MSSFKKLIYLISGKPFLPKDIINGNGKLLLHISDTPESFYSTLKSIINQLKPNYIVHTGDLVDNIKLEIRPYKINYYKKRVSDIIDIMENSSADKVFIALGNHDDKSAVMNYVNRSKIIDLSDNTYIQNINVMMSHYPNEILKSPGDLNLFGHNISLYTNTKNKKIYLNGIMNINIINLDTLDLFTLPYPFGTDEKRLCKKKIGL